MCGCVVCLGAKLNGLLSDGFEVVVPSPVHVKVVLEKTKLSLSSPKQDLGLGLHQSNLNKPLLYMTQIQQKIHILKTARRSPPQ